MAQTANATLEPDLEIDPLAATRARLRGVIERIRAEQAKLTSLEEGQTKAREQWHQASHRLSDAQDALRKAIAEEPSRLANAFVSNGAVEDDPVALANGKISAAQTEVSRLDKVEAALASEIERSQGSLRALRATQYELMSAVICGSDEYRLLIESHRAAWKQLRSVKEALRVVSTSLAGYLPQHYLDEAGLAEPLEPRVGYEVDANLVNSWREAMAQLAEDHETELPIFG
jgi:hypothetical protein